MRLIPLFPGGVAFGAGVLALVLFAQSGTAQGVGGAGGSGHTDAVTAMRRPLESLAGQRILVLPVQYAVFADTLGWSAQVPAVRDYLRTVDDEITFALRERGLEANWILSDVGVQSARRNASYAADPYAIQASQLRPGGRTDVFILSEPLASQLRSLVALNDARYVLFPVEVRFTGSMTGGKPGANGVATPRVAVGRCAAVADSMGWRSDLCACECLFSGAGGGFGVAVG
jgi:hypothetical protein